MRGAPTFPLRLAAAVVLFVAGPGAGAQPLPAPSAQVVQQKIAMIDRVLDKSSLATRVEAGSSDTARRHVANALELLGHAKLLAMTGQAASADQLLNASLWEIGRARQLVPDPATQVASERARSQREDRALWEAASRLAGQTIVYDRRFTNPRQEFDFELDRHRSFERLVPVAIERFRPGPDVQARIARFVEQAGLLREKGEAAAAADLPGAIRLVVEGTEALLGALQVAGLVVPPSAGADK